MSFDFKCKICPPETAFESTGWKTKKLRDARAAQHMEEHETGEPMQELHEFRIENGVEV